MNNPLVVIFVGIPGSGKTTFARQLANKLGAVLLNSDSIRMEMWGSVEKIQATHITPEERKYTNKLTFGAMNYAANQIVIAGKSVVYDCNANSRQERDEKHEIAARHGALSVVVRIKVPYELSLERIQSREATHDQRQISAERAAGVLESFKNSIEEPTMDERVIEISGDIPFEEQYGVFVDAISKFDAPEDK